MTHRPRPSRALLRQIALYGTAGGLSALVDFSVYILLLRLGTWYIAASVISFLLSFATAFLLHRFIVFRGKRSFGFHLRRHFATELVNIALGTLLLSMLVEGNILDEEWAKIATMASVACWNFLLFKFLVFT